MYTRTDRIRALNDNLRQLLPSGLAIMTPGADALANKLSSSSSRLSQCTTIFCHFNDLHEEHDFGPFEADGQTIFFKIEYYDKTLDYHSPDPSDPCVTKRVITIMLADEY